MNKKSLSNRGKAWLIFSELVLEHIENYTVPQYGDAPDDEVEDWTADQCAKAIKKYSARHGKNQRSGNDKLDMLKAAHFSQICHDKIE